MGFLLNIRVIFVNVGRLCGADYNPLSSGNGEDEGLRRGLKDVKRYAELRTALQLSG